MYGSEVSGTALAATGAGVGFLVGSWVLGVVAVALLGVGLYLLLRRESKVRP